MSAIYQGEVIELTPQDLQVLEQELNPDDDYQSLIIAESAFGQELDNHEDSKYSCVEEYVLALEARWESDYEPRPLTEEEENEWLEYENGRMESDLLESEENYF